MIEPRRCQELDDVAAHCAMTMRAAPCASVACAYRMGGRWQLDVGAHGHLAPGESQVDPDTPFDLASVTKPVAALTLARLVRRGLVDWHMPLGVPVRDVHGTPSTTVPLSWLVAHRAGLEAHLPLYAPLEKGGQVNPFHALQQAGRARRASCQGEPSGTGFPALYSDLGYLLLGEALARASAACLDDLFDQEVAAPLGLGIASVRKWRQQSPDFDRRVAPTENIPWRGGVVRGVVHDENAFAMAGDASCAHAGLFGTAGDVAALGAAILDAVHGLRDRWLTPEQIAPLVRKPPDGTLRAGFDGKSATGSSAGRRCSAETFGHLGFTGTSLWMDPTREVVVVLLTNRVHPTRDHLAIKSARPWVHEALFAWGDDCRSE